MTILAATAWKTNAYMISDVAHLGYLQADWRVLDPTYGLGNFWTRWRPFDLVTHDLALDGVDVRNLPYDDDEFDAVVFDPPYKLNGTPTMKVDSRYGVADVQNRDARHQLIYDGIDECARVLRPGGFLLLKCQDQVNSGQVRWQSHLFTRHAEDQHGMRLVDVLLMLGGRAQPVGRRQVHARRNYSTLLVLQS